MAVIAVFGLVSCTSKDNRKLVNSEKSKFFGYSKSGNKIVYNYTDVLDSKFLWQQAVHLWVEVPADTKTFEVLGPSIGRDKNHIFGGSKIIDFVDYATLRYDNGAYIDKNNVYTIAFIDDETNSPTLNVVPKADPQTYRVLGAEFYSSLSPFAKDKNHIFYKEKIMKDVDYDSFKVIAYNIYADKNFIHIKDLFSGKMKFPNKNHSTEGFHYITYDNFYSPKYYYWFDSHNHTLREFPIKDINSVRGFKKNIHFFSIDGDVYFDGVKMHDVDLATFKVYSRISWFANDKNHLFSDGKIVPNINPAELKFQEGDYVGGGRMWYRGQIWDNLDHHFREPTNDEIKEFKKAFKK